jgi:hypothetical protein
MTGGPGGQAAAPAAEAGHLASPETEPAAPASEPVVRQPGPAEPKVASPAPAARPPVPPAPGAAVSATWRGVVLVAVITIFLGVTAVWIAEAWNHPLAMLAILGGFAGLLVCAILALILRGYAAMRRLELGVLALSLMFWALSQPRKFSGGGYPGDEGTLSDLAGRALQHGSDPYALSWPHAFAGWNTGITTLLNGQIVTRFEYPPVSLVLNALAHPILGHLPVAGVLATAALGLTAILLFFLLPSPWRAAAPMVCLSLGLYASSARRGDPTIIALPLLILAAYRWTSIGQNGRLGRLGRMSAVCLGLAAATQQLTWFFAPFLVTAIYLACRGAQPARASARVTASYAAIAAATFAVINLPFAIWNFSDWLGAIISPLTQGAVPWGQGLVGITYYVTKGTGELSFYNYGALLYIAGLFVCFVLFFRRLGPALAVLPWTVFFFSVRALDSYYYLFIALFVVSVLTIDYAVIERAYQPGGRLRQRLRLDTRARGVALTALFGPAAACLAIAIGSPQPLRLTVTPPAGTRPESVISTVTVTATNVSGRPITPHFGLSDNPGITAAWVVDSGPRTLPPGATATYVISAPFGLAARQAGPHLVLRAFSADPATLSSGVIAVRP